MKLIRTTLDKYLAAKERDALGEEDIYFVHDKGIYVGSQKIFSEGDTGKLTLREGILTPASPSEKLLSVLDDDGQPLDREDIVSYDVDFSLSCGIDGNIPTFWCRGSYTSTTVRGWSNDAVSLVAQPRMQFGSNKVIFAYLDHILSAGRVRIYGVYLYALSMDGEVTFLGHFDDAQEENYYYLSPGSWTDHSFWWSEGTVIAKCRK